MPLYLDTRGRTKLAIAICGRCGVKYPYDELSDDPNYPGLRVCPDGCKDQLDPWRLPARPTEDITLQYPRPDLSLTTRAPTPAFFVPSFYGIQSIGFARPWQAQAVYTKGDSVTPLDVDLETTTLPQNWFVATTAGTSGLILPPGFSLFGDVPAGVIVADGFEYLTDDHGVPLKDDNGNFLTTDDGVGGPFWLCLGVYPN